MPIDSEAQYSLVGEVTSVRSSVLDALGALLTLTGGLVSSGTRRDLRDAHARICTHRFNLAVLGEFKRGKSTLINALLDRELLPTGVLPLTSVVTAIAAGPADRLVVHYADGRSLDRPLAELPQYVTEAGNPHNRLGVELARLELDHELLRAGLELVDTPGIGSIHSHNTDVARDFLPRVDAALYVLDATQPLSDAERQMLSDAARRIPRLMIIVNKIDHLDQADRAVALEFVRSTLEGPLGSSGAELYGVSARHHEGLAPLRARLLELASGERESLLLRSVAGVGHNVALSGAQAARFEARAIQLPLDELASRARQFDQRIAELRAAGAEAGDLLERGISRALASLVNEPLQAHARRQEAALRRAVRQRAAELQRSSPRELTNELQSWTDGWVQSAFADLVPRFESAIADALTELEIRYAARVRDILEEVHAAAQDVFGVRAGEVLPETGLRAPSRFSFKLHDVENALDMIVGRWPHGRPRDVGTLARGARRRAAADRHDRSPRRPPALRARRAGHERSSRVSPRSHDRRRRGGRGHPRRGRPSDRGPPARSTQGRRPAREALTDRARLRPHRTADAALAAGPRPGGQPGAAAPRVGWRNPQLQGQDAIHRHHPRQPSARHA